MELLKIKAATAHETGEASPSGTTVSCGLWLNWPVAPQETGEAISRSLILRVGETRAAAVEDTGVRGAEAQEER